MKGHKNKVFSGFIVTLESVDVVKHDDYKTNHGDSGIVGPLFVVAHIVCEGFVFFLYFLTDLVFSVWLLLRQKAGQEGRGEILLENSFMR